MNRPKIPQTDSIEELAQFWDTHELTDFEDELEEVTDPVFKCDTTTTMAIHLRPEEVESVKRITKSKGVGDADLLRAMGTRKIIPILSLT